MSNIWDCECIDTFHKGENLSLDDEDLGILAEIEELEEKMEEENEV